MDRITAVLGELALSTVWGATFEGLERDRSLIA